MYRKNTASQYVYFCLVNATTGAALTGATVTAYRALDNGAQATATGTTTELANGQYRFNLSQADTNGDYGSYLFTATNAVPVEKTVVFTQANPQDAAAFGLSRLDQTVGSRMATYTQPTGFLAADFTRLDATVSSRMATFSLPANFAALGINASGHVTRVVLVDTTTTNSDMITAAGVRSAVGLASANLDSQLADIPTVSEFNARTLPSASYFDPATDAVNVDRWSGQSVSLDSDNLPVVSVENYYDTSLLSWLPISGRFSTIVTSLNTIDDFIDTEISAIKNVTDLLDSMIESDGAGQFRFDTIAMSMAPSGGGGGGNPWLTDIGTGYTGTQAGKVLMDAKAKTDLITAGNVTYTSMVDPDGEIPGPIFIGDDYKTVHANAFSWTIPAIPGMTAATAVVRFGGVNALLGRAWLVTGTATDLGGGLWRLVCEMDKSVSANLLPGLYDWTVEVSLTGGNEITRIYSDRKVEVRSKPT